jgi:hypothetical protein
MLQVETGVHHLAHIGSEGKVAHEQGFDDIPFRVRQVTRIAPLISLVFLSVLVCPHFDLLSPILNSWPENPVKQALIERTKAGLKSAKARGRTGGRKPKLTSEQIEMAKGLLASGKAPRDVAKAFGVGRSTLYRYVPGDTSTADEEVVQPWQGDATERAGSYAKPTCVFTAQPPAAPEFVSRWSKTAPNARLQASARLENHRFPTIVRAGACRRARNSGPAALRRGREGAHGIDRLCARLFSPD